MTVYAKRMRMAMNAMRRSNEETWIVCLVASREVGNRDGGTGRLADVLQKSVSQVENYADAGKGYRLFRKSINSDTRSRLHPGHFRELYRVWKNAPPDKQETISKEAGAFLVGAVEMNMKVEEMRDSILAEYQIPPGPATLGKRWWQKGWSGIEKSDLVAEQREKALGLFRAFQEIMKGH